MRMLWPLCARWTYWLLMRTLIIHICQMFSLYTISIHIRNWCMHWVCVSGTDDCSEHTHQELMCVLSICLRNYSAFTERSPFKKFWVYAPGTEAYRSVLVRNWCIRWAYVSGTDAYPENQIWKDTFTSNYAEHKCKELMRELSVHVRKWCVPLAYASEIQWCLLPPKLK